MKARYACPKPVKVSRRKWPSRVLHQSPIWCAVDLRDGNQALPNPMTPAQKKRYFQLLVEIGFKEIEVGFPSASADDFQFCRDLIEQNLIPADVTISVLTQAREHLILKTIEALKGVRRGVIHVYAATSELHMRFVFNKTAEETKAMTVDAVRLIREKSLTDLAGSEILLEFSPEELTDTDLDFAVDICDSVIEAWQPKTGEKVILNLPATVERRLPNQYADMIEEFMYRQKHGEQSIISLHAHNDMGSAVAATEMALLAGAHRVEGTLFGHGESCGKVDLITIVLNLQYLGVNTGLKFDKIEKIRDELVELTGIGVHPRHPYAGELVFTAFSGSHQDAIHKGLMNAGALTKHFGSWKVPYLHIDPRDLGRSFEKFIRINSQSGKGGIAYVLQQETGIHLPRPLLQDFSAAVQAFADKAGREVEANELIGILRSKYVLQDTPVRLLNYWPRPTAADPTQIEGEVHVEFNGQAHTLKASAPGPIAAFVRAVQQLPLPFTFKLDEYEEDSIGSDEEAEAVTFVKLSTSAGATRYGIGFGVNIDQAAVRAIVSALNGLLAGK